MLVLQCIKSENLRMLAHTFQSCKSKTNRGIWNGALVAKIIEESFFTLSVTIFLL